VPHLASPSHEAVSPQADHVPASWWAGAAVHVAPMPRGVQLGYAGRGARFVTVDPHEPVTAGDGVHGGAVFGRFDGVFVSHEELHAPGPLAERAAAVHAARFVAVKCAEHGGWVHDHVTGRGRAWAARATTVVDATGAGDAFAAGFVAGLLRGEGVERCCQRGVVSASFALEDWGARGLMAADPATAERRLAAWYDEATAGTP
jgi:sugar/nucleoside kinase (ribokinase family)